VVSVVIAACTALVLWRGSLLIISGAMTAGALTVFLAYLAKFFDRRTTSPTETPHS